MVYAGSFVLFVVGVDRSGLKALEIAMQVALAHGASFGLTDAKIGPQVRVNVFEGCLVYEGIVEAEEKQFYGRSQGVKMRPIIPMLAFGIRSV